MLRSEVLINHSKQLSNTWLDDYKFANIPMSYMPNEAPQHQFLHPVIHDIVYTQAGDVHVQNISIFTTGTIITIFLLCGFCCYKFENYRTCCKKWMITLLKKIYNCFTSQTFRTKRENTRMRQEIEVRKEAI